MFFRDAVYFLIYSDFILHSPITDKEAILFIYLTFFQKLLQLLGIFFGSRAWERNSKQIGNDIFCTTAIREYNFSLLAQQRSWLLADSQSDWLHGHLLIIRYSIGCLSFQRAFRVLFENFFSFLIILLSAPGVTVVRQHVQNGGYFLHLLWRKQGFSYLH